jgi:hypothetical protein
VRQEKVHFVIFKPKLKPNPKPKLKPKPKPKPNLKPKLKPKFRLVKGQGITAFEVLEFTLSTFLFTNALVSFQTANAHILEGHKEITNAGQAAEAAKKPPGFLDRFTTHFEAENLFDKNSRVIRTLNSIEKPKEFFTKSVELTKQVGLGLILVQGA